MALSNQVLEFTNKCIPTKPSTALIATHPSRSARASKSFSPRRASRTSRTVAPIAARPARRSAAGGGGGGSYAGGGGYGGGGGSRPQREMFEVTCSNCGGKATVPFQPRGDKPVYCRDCFQSRSGSYR